MELCEQSMQILETNTENKVEQNLIPPKDYTCLPKTPHKRKMLTIAEKMEIITAIKNGASNASICKQKLLTSSSVSSIWKSRETIIAAFECNKAKAKRLRLCDKSDLEELLASWVRDQIKQNISITRPLIKEKAAEFAEKLGYTNYTCHNSWLDRFKIRNNITYGKTREKKNIGKEINSNVAEISQIWMDVNDVKLKTMLEEQSESEQWISTSLKDEELETNDISLNNNLKKDVQNAIHTLFLFYKTNDISSEFQNHLSQIKQMVDNHFDKKEFSPTKL